MSNLVAPLSLSQRASEVVQRKEQERAPAIELAQKQALEHCIAAIERAADNGEYEAICRVLDKERCRLVQERYPEASISETKHWTSVDHGTAFYRRVTWPKPASGNK
jgi:hypothetical protein